MIILSTKCAISLKNNPGYYRQEGHECENKARISEIYITNAKEDVCLAARQTTEHLRIGTPLYGKLYVARKKKREHFSLFDSKLVRFMREVCIHTTCDVCSLAYAALESQQGVKGFLGVASSMDYGEHRTVRCEVSLEESNVLIA